MSKEAMKLALEALEYIEHNYMSLPAPAEKAITALREALAEQPAQQEFVSPGGGYVPAIPAQQRPIKTFHDGKAWPVQEPAQQDSTCSNALRIQGKAYPRTCKKCGLGPCVELAQQALDKMAENARALGLDYEPAQQEPLQNNPFDCGVYLGSGKDYAIKHHVSYGPAQQEPVAWMFQHEETGRTLCVDSQQVEWGFEERNPRYQKIAPLYTSPPAQRKPLTDEEIILIVADCASSHQHTDIHFARAIEAAHGIKEKNT